MANALTHRQQELLTYLRDVQTERGVMPSSREIQAHFGFASQTAAMDLLRALERKGAIQRLPGKARAVILPKIHEEPHLVRIPVYGNIAAGMPQDGGTEPEGTLTIDPQTLGIPYTPQTFALKVRGNSMIDAHILNGDLVILDPREPRPGDVVAALIDGETTLKRYLLEQGQPYLKAENEDFPDLRPVNEMSVQGVMVGLIRNRAA